MKKRFAQTDPDVRGPAGIPDDPLGFQMRMIEILEASGLERFVSDLQRAVATWKDTDRRYRDNLLVRHFSVGQPVWMDGSPGVVRATSKHRVTIEIWYPSREGPRSDLRTKAPSNVHTATTRRDVMRWRQKMMDFGVNWREVCAVSEPSGTS